MYTQVTFGQFLNTVLEQSGIGFKHYPNLAIEWKRGDWSYEILNDMSVRVFRFAVPDRQIKVEGPKWRDRRETRESFQPRFADAFNEAIANLQSAE